MTSREKAVRNKDKATRLNEAWGVGATQVRYSDGGHWYATLARFPAALFDPQGYLFFATERDYRTAPLNIGKQISVPRPGISGLPGYVRVDPSVPSGATDPDDVSVTEGRERLRLHRLRERDAGLVARKKRRVLAAYGRLACEACGFDFAATYGELGEGFAECHHVVPVAQTQGERQTTLADLAIVCANCHRMLHRRPWRTLAGLRALLSSRNQTRSDSTAFA